MAVTILLRCHGVAADPEQIRHRMGAARVGVTEILRCAKEFGLKARAQKTSWSRLAVTPLPGIALLRDGGFLILGKVGRRQAAGSAPVVAPARNDDAGRTRGDLGRRHHPDDAARGPDATSPAASISPGFSARSTNIAACSAKCWSPRSSSRSSPSSHRCSSRWSSTRCSCIAA